MISRGLALRRRLRRFGSWMWTQPHAHVSAVEHFVLSVVAVLQAVEGALEEDERVPGRREVEVVDAPDDDPMVASGMLADDLAIERGQGVGEQRRAATAGRPPDAPEAVGSRRHGTGDELLTVPPQHVDGEAAGA